MLEGVWRLMDFGKCTEKGRACQTVRGKKPQSAVTDICQLVSEAEEYAFDRPLPRESCNMAELGTSLTSDGRHQTDEAGAPWCEKQSEIRCIDGSINTTRLTSGFVDIA
jgi:hypothetical protein